MKAQDTNNGFFKGAPSLQNLQMLISGVYLPSLVETDQTDDKVVAAENNVGSNIDFMNSEITLEIPVIKIDDVKACAQDEQIMAVLERALEHWTQSIRVLLEKVNNKEREGEGPISEIEYWRNRYASLGAIYEQLHDNSVVKMLEVLREGEAHMLPGFDDQWLELTKLYVEAKDNVKFLQTLERHFKNISRARGSLLLISDTLPSMMNAIRMVWVISRHYNTDKRMIPLMELIANEIADKVLQYVNLKIALQKMYDTPSVYMKKLEESAEVLRKWKMTYETVRNKIETTKRDARWNFDREKLFDRTDHIGDRCMDLHEIAQTIARYKAFFGPELRAVTGDTYGIDEVLAKVKNLLAIVQNVKYDIFDKRALRNWVGVMKEFREQVDDISNQTNHFIDKSFKKLRSSESAFKLLQDVKSIQSQDKDSFLSKMMLKSIDILERYSVEIEFIRDIFKNEKDNPPRSKNLPPTAGKIYWADSLFQRIAKPMILFQTSKEMLSGIKGEQIKGKSVDVGKLIRDYAEGLFRQWSKEVSEFAVTYLNMFILKKDSSGKSFVNFHPDLILLIQETKYLDKFGRKVPEVALNVTLQEEKYHTYVENLRHMLEHFHETMNLLDKADKNLLKTQIAKLEKTLEPGFNVLNWNSLGIEEFIRKCNFEISEFFSTVNKVQKNASLIKSLVSQIGNCNLIKEVQMKRDELLDLQQLFAVLEEYKSEQIAALVKKYKTIAQTLLKIEGDLISANVITNKKDVNGREPLLKEYYEYWEQKIFKALTKMLKKSFQVLQQLLCVKQAKGSNQKAKPLIKMTVSLSHNQIVKTPDTDDVVKMVDKIMKSLFEGTKAFVRWMNGTCIEVANVENKGKDNSEDNIDVIIREQFSFFKDITEITSLMKMNMDIHKATESCMRSVHQYIKRYNKFEDYWKIPKEMAIEKFGAKNPKWSEYDAQLEKYATSMKDFQNHTPEREIDFLRVDCQPLLKSIQDEIGKWIVVLGKLMNTNIRPKLQELHEKIMDLMQKVKQPVTQLDDLRNVLEVIDNIKSKSVKIERTYREIEDCYNTLQNFEIEVSDEERQLIVQVQADWEQLREDASRIDKKLEPEKAKFTEATKASVEQFKDSIQSMKKSFESGAGNPHMELEKGLGLMERAKQKMEEIRKQRNYLILSEKLFNLPITSYPDLVELEQQIAKFAKIYDVFAEWKSKVDDWSKTLWQEVQIEQMTKEATRFAVLLKQDFPKDIQSMPTHKTLKESVKSFQSSIPLFTMLKSDGLRERHWNKLMESTGVKFDMNPTTFTLQNLIDMKLYKFKDTIEEISNDAKKELNVETLIAAIAETWQSLKFQLKKHVRDKKDRGYILTAIDVVKQKLEEDTANLAGSAGARYAIPFLEEITKWQKRLSLIEEVTTAWLAVQTSWMYLEIIFLGSEDIREQLPTQAKAFEKIDADWTKIMNDTAKAKSVLEACSVEDRLSALNGLQTRLNECQKGLSQYLQTKRDSFPRFFFISDDELLTILGSSEIKNIQKQMLKMFENCEELIVKPNTRLITGMTSAESESFSFATPVAAEGPVEKWLTQVEEEMRKTLKFKTKEAVFFYPKKQRIQWMKDNIGMVTLCGSQIWWTWECEDAFRRVKQGEKMAVKTFASKLSKQLNDLVDIVRTPLDKLSRKKATTMIIIDVHARDIVDGLVRDSILDEREFEWESQLRFYWDKALDDIIIKQCTGQFEYGYEYMGLNGRLAITPLTDRCFMTLTQALTFHLGGSPAGPAGTGKTESVKDLAKSMAIMCRVFNCGEGIDYQVMHENFAGLCQTGAWGCFDEFNRIELPVLSVVSTQIRSIQSALTAGISRFRFEDGDINLSAKTGIFITMNPGYAGRVELPDNLKALFRPCVMVVPDMEIICEIMLLSEGFNAARNLARKMTKLYKLAEGQLSKQNHYDWGLRALKACLVVAGRLKRENPDKNEQELLMRALRDMNLPKFIFEDTPLFLDLLNDLFVNLQIEKLTYPALQKAIETDLAKNNYQLIENQVAKVIQLYETMNTRHCVMVVGGTCGGKSVVIETLKNAQTELKLPTKLYTLNPKAQSVNELYGVLDPVSRDWKDGLLSNIYRQVNQKAEKGEERRYILFDGDVDAVWIENMNSVMDDNKLLTLPNSERITLLYPQCSLLFEVGDLTQASPATVSRCGMVYVDPKNLGFEPYIYRWITMSYPEQTEKEKHEMFSRLFSKYAQACIKYVLKGVDHEGNINAPLKTAIPLCDVALAAQVCAILQSILKASEIKVDEERELECIFIFAVVWGIGGAILDEDRAKFDDFVKFTTTWPSVDNGEHLDKPVSAGSFPKRQTMYEYFYDIPTKCWLSWKSTVPSYAKPADNKFSSILVPTVDTVRYTWLLKSTMSVQRPYLLVGGAGTAKTVIIQNHLKQVNNATPDKLATLIMNLSSRTSSMDVQRIIEDNIEKRFGDTYGPLSGKAMNVFIDDLNMPKIDKYGTQQPIALLKLLFEKGGMYDRGESLVFLHLRDLQYVAAMAPPGGGRNSVDPRFISKFSVFNISFPSEDSVKHIYSSILDAHLKPYPETVFKLVSKITDATLALYNSVVAKLPPTPSKFHYVFNLRDLSRVYEGLGLSTVDKFAAPAAFVRLWRNECMRVFYDRLVTQPDKDLVSGQIEETLKKFFSEHAESAMANPILFGDFLDVNDKDSLRLYDDMKDYNSIKKVVEEVLDTYNEANSKKIDLVMFEDALEHLTRIHRIIRMNRGHALLVGVGGSGKQSLTKLAAFTAGYEVFTITVTRNYGETQFRDHLKELYNKLGAENKKMVFLFTDAHVVDPGFLEFVNNMLTTGSVPALFADDEKEPLKQTVAKELKELNIPETPENCWNYFVDKCRDNLHIVLAMSPAGDTLRIRCRNFPGLVNNTTIDWFTPWPEQALTEVASRFLTEETLPDEIRSQLVQHMVTVHQSVNSFSHKYEEQLRRHNYVTPKNYLDYIATYRKLLYENRLFIDNQSKRLETGLNRLLKAKTEVEAMKQELSAAKIIVQQKTEENAVLIETIQKNQAEAISQKKNAQEKEKFVTEEFQKITVEKEEAESILEAAEPALKDAETALENLNKNDLTEIKTMANPPELVQDVCSCVAILLSSSKTADVSFKGAKVFMSDASFITKLQNFDKSKLNSQKIKMIKELYKKNGPIFETQAIKGRSQAAAGLFVWVEAMVKYYKVFKDVEPKKRALEKAEKDLADSQAELDKISKKLKQLESELADLNEKYKRGEKEARMLKEKADAMEKKLNAANKLIDGLSSERIRWTKQIEEFKDKRHRLVGDCLLSAAFLCYTGAFTFDFRNEMINVGWISNARELGIPVSENFKIDSLLVSDVLKSQWAFEGLPQDDVSIQNGILTTRASRFPLCVDPQLQAVTWIKNKEKDLVVKSFNDPNFMKELEMAIKFGKSFLFENVDEYIDPMIDPVLEMDLSAKNRVVKLGGEEVDCDDKFKLFMCTRLSNPHYSPEVSGKTTIVNYSVTENGLQNQLLNVIINHERPEIEEQRRQLVQTMSENKTLLNKLEDQILQELNNQSGDKSLIENEELIGTLEITKTKVAEINFKLQQSEETSKDIEKARMQYNPAAKRGATLYFVMASLVNINTMYEYSLSSYMHDVFEQSLEKSEPSKVIEGRLDNIIEHLTFACYTYTCTGLFEKHKLTFAFQLTIKIMQGDNRIVPEELDFFLKGNTALEKVDKAKPCVWLSDQGWKDLLKLKTMNPVFDTLPNDLEKNESNWKVWYDLEMPEMAELPMKYSERLTPFQVLLVIKCFRVDRIILAVTNFIKKEMKEKFVKPPLLDYENVYKQSNPLSPIVCMISPGYDPAGDILKLCAKLDKQYRTISLGQGQGPKAKEMLEKGIEKGYWVILQNCHLLVKWMKNVEKILDAMGKGKVHNEFRLWLTTEVSPEFPIGILQKSLKVVTEPPNSLLLNVSSTFSTITEDQLDCPHSAFRSLVFVLAFFHAVIQERRKYGKIGWNVAYDFNRSDYDVSFSLMKTYLTKAYEFKDPIPWDSLKYLIGEAMYGGRVTDFYDRRVLTTYLDEYMGEFLFDKFQPFHFFTSDTCDYKLPDNPLERNIAKKEWEDFVDKTIRLNNSPEVFGLHPNAEISYLTNSSRAMWTDLIELQPRSVGSSSGISREEYIDKIAKDILDKIPEPFDRNALMDRIARPNPIQVVLLQEVERWNNLVVRMNMSLLDLRRALKGDIGMSNELDDLAASLFNGTLPQLWAPFAPATKKNLANWLDHFNKRFVQYDNWIKKNTDPDVIWLSGLHVPDSYLTAIVQMTCKKYKWPLDRTTLFTKVTSYTDAAQVKQRPEDGCFVQGLFMEGAAWDLPSVQLRKQDPKVLVVPLPILEVVPVENSKLKLQNTFKSPVYVTSNRRSPGGVGLVFEADMASYEHKSHWVLQGVALYLNDD